MEAPIGYLPSFTWRSIIHGREALELGLLWNVGNGNSIDIWQDKWIPRPSGFRAIRGSNPISPTRVVELIDWDRAAWDVEKVKRTFETCDAELILSLKLVCPEKPDEQIWFFTKNGLFTVRSAYHALVDHQRNLGSASASSSRNGACSLWRSLWRLQVPPRVKNFIWRACRNLLPTRDNLMNRKICMDCQCDKCGGAESILHALFWCPRARTFWKCAPQLKVWKRSMASMLDVFQLVCGTLSETDLALWCLICWNVWKARNKSIFEGVESDPGETVKAQKTFLSEFRSSRLHPCPVSVCKSPTKWCKPDAGMVKANCDASVSAHGTGLGFIVRAETGNAILIGTSANSFSPDPEIAEAEAILWAMECCARNGMTRVCFESDCLPIISKIRHKQKAAGTLGWFLHKILVLEKWFNRCTWSHIKRCGNEPAHYLASLRPDSEFCSPYFTAFSSKLVLLLANDLS